MGVAGGIKVEGAARLRRTLGDAGVALGDFRDLHLRVAGVVADRAKATSPIGPDAGGHVRDTIRPGATRGYAIVRAGNSRMTYPQPIHWGWFRHGIRPNPWVSRAAQETEPEWFRIYSDGLEAIIRNIKGA